MVAGGFGCARNYGRDVCRSFDDRQPKETIVPHGKPWVKVGVDLFIYKGLEYLIAVDYYSTFWEIDCTATQCHVL